MGVTTRLSITTPESSDPVSQGDDRMRAAFTTLDDAAMWLSGTFASRPIASATVPGLFYLATDTLSVYVSTGTAWVEVAPGSGTVPIGTMLDYAGSTSPADTRFVLCDGSAYSRTTYAAAFAVLGTQFGAGDGSTTFNVPDARGRSTAMAGTATGDPNAVAKVFATKIGSDKHSHTVNAHSHTVNSHSHSVPAHYHGKGTIAIGASGSHSHTDSGHGHGISDPGHAHGVYDPGHWHYTINGTWVYAASGSNGGQFGIAGGSNYTLYRGDGYTTSGAGTGISINGAGTGVSVNTGAASIQPSTHSHATVDFSGNVGATASGTNGDLAMTSGNATPGTDSQSPNTNVIDSNDPKLIVNKIIRIA